MTSSQSLANPNWENLPRPEDDGAADHLLGMEMPDIALQATDGGQVTLSGMAGPVVVYAYPMTGRPDRALPAGWDDIPGARGCTPQSCAFRDHHAELQSLGATAVFGLSTQSPEDQAEAAARLHLPFALLSDANLDLAHVLDLPSFEVEGRRLLRRLTLLVQNGHITHLRYPVFPPDSDAEAVAQWLKGLA
ncbi:peroxiredoxin [Roseovarius sp. MMSF_3281]|uniref:peroxiredoxin n=1 Tax=Roseovarius sp. MMSF_3281 TaxID=3046694 RepID=UPI00273F58E3|nr:peroxiredoxin [Roseovarius sp. MMSF_3281]